MKTIIRLSLVFALLLAMPAWGAEQADVIYGPAQYPTLTCVGSCQDVVEPMNRKSFTDLIDPDCKSWTTLYPPGNPSCLSGLSGGCVQICTERQKKEVCAKRPELVGCEGSPCMPAHLLSLLQQQAEFASEAKLLQMAIGTKIDCGMVDPKDPTRPLPTVTITPGAIDPETRVRWKQVTEEVQQTLKECK